jgi:hypothetical protein
MKLNNSNFTNIRKEKITFREAVLTEVRKCQEVDKRAAIIMCICFFAILILSIFRSIYFLIIPIAFYLYGTFLTLKARRILDKNVRCPFCDISLGYIFKRGYTSNYKYWGHLFNFPNDIECCPNCKTPLTQKI